MLFEILDIISLMTNDLNTIKMEKDMMPHKKINLLTLMLFFTFSHFIIKLFGDKKSHHFKGFE
jgi:hypothetical protein